jgi:hypothetical protein
MVMRLIEPLIRLNNAASTGDDIAFNPAADVAADGRMKLAKAEEYLMQTFKSLRFFEESGKFYFEGNVAAVPEGFRNDLSISIGFKRELGLPVAAYGSYPTRAEADLPKAGQFKEEIKGISRRDQIGSVRITLCIDAPKHTNTTYNREGYEVIWVISSNNDNRIDVYDCTTYEKELSKFYDLAKIFQW